MMMDADNVTLVMIDYQPRLLPAIRHGQKLVARSVTLGRIAALLDVPVIGTEQSPAKLGENVPSIRRLCAETLSKSRFDASEALRTTALAQRRQVVLCGCEAHVCVLQTALGLQRLGFEVFVVEDAVGARRQGDKSAALARLSQAGVTLVTLETVSYTHLTLPTIYSV